MNKTSEMLRPFPQEHISLLPTPFHHLDTLSKILDYNVYIKRDDLTGFAFGGNKTRKFDFLVADAKAKGCDTIIGMGANQSNFCRILSCVGSKYGFTVHLVLNGKKPEKPTGNLLIDYMAGAKIHHIETENPDIHMKEALKLNDKLKAQGKNVYFLPPGGSIPIGAFGYAAGFSELLDDFQRANIKIDKIFHASSSGGTQAGLVLGQSINNWDGQIIGISVDVPKIELKENVFHLASEAARLINTNVKESIVYVDDSYIGEGYGKRTPQCIEAVNLFAKCEGIFLDYVYTGKAAAGLIDYCQTGKIKQNENIAFLHTGGNIEIFE